MPRRAEAESYWRSLDNARPHVKDFRGKLEGRGAIPAVSAFFSQEDLQADYTKWGARRPQWINWSSAPKRASSGHEEITHGTHRDA
jgi:hypothetical protein